MNNIKKFNNFYKINEGQYEQSDSEILAEELNIIDCTIEGAEKYENGYKLFIRSSDGVLGYMYVTSENDDVINIVTDFDDEQ